jgi:hypothetical protein
MSGIFAYMILHKVEGLSLILSCLVKNDMAMANFCCADRLPSLPIIFISNPPK